MSNISIISKVESLIEFQKAELKSLAITRGMGKKSAVDAYDKAFHQKLEEIAKQENVSKDHVISEFLRIKQLQYTNKQLERCQLS